MYKLKQACCRTRQRDVMATESVLMERLHLIHRKTDLKIRKDNLYLINV